MKILKTVMITECIGRKNYPIMDLIITRLKDLKKDYGKIITSSYRIKPKKRRPGVHAKSKTSKLKSSKNYSKRYRGQGK